MLADLGRVLHSIGNDIMTRVRLTYEDYAALPDDGRRYELHEGELSVTPSPGLDHQDILGNLFVILRNHVNAGGPREGVRRSRGLHPRGHHRRSA